MEKFKIWLKKNWSTAILVALFIILLVSPDAKAWLMRQIVSTGLLNSNIEEKKSSEKTEIKNTETAALEFSVKDENGKIITTSQLKGKVIFINFWASWCPPCRAEFPSIQKFYDKYKSDSNVVFLTVNLDDDLAAGKMYLKKENFSIPFLVPESNIPNEYYNGSLPTTVVLDKKGLIRLHHAGMADYSKASFYEQIDELLKE